MLQGSHHIITEFAVAHPKQSALLLEFLGSSFGLQHQVGLQVCDFVLNRRPLLRTLLLSFLLVQRLRFRWQDLECSTMHLHCQRAQVIRGNVWPFGLQGMVEVAEEDMATRDFLRLLPLQCCDAPVDFVSLWV